MHVYSIGVDLGGTNLRIAAVDSDGKLLEKLTTGAEIQRGRDFVISEMSASHPVAGHQIPRLGTTGRHRHRRARIH